MQHSAGEIEGVTQRCPRCDEDLPLDAYHPDKQGKQGHYCRPCMIDYKREWRRARGQRTRADHVEATRRRCAGCDGRPSSKNAKYCEECRESLAQEPSSAYGATHARLRTERGAAALYDCTECGGPARDWAYDHADPDELSAILRGYEVSYSADLARYKPMCKPCHSRFDAQDSKRRTPCMGPGCAARLLPPFDYCRQHRPTVAEGKGAKLRPEITALVLARAGQATDVCRKCKTEKPVTDFSRDQRRPKGYITLCRPCMNLGSGERYHRRRAQVTG